MTDITYTRGCSLLKHRFLFCKDIHFITHFYLYKR